LRTGCWFYLGALGVTLLIGVAAAFVLGDAAASSDPSSPKTWVAIVDLVAAALLIAYGSFGSCAVLATRAGRGMMLERFGASRPRAQSRSSAPALRSRTRAASSRSH
jgi:hypothetical protein